MLDSHTAAVLLLTAKRNVVRRRDETPIHAAADVYLRPMTLAVGYALLRGKKAYADGGVDGAVEAVRDGLLESLPPVLLKCAVAGGQASVAGLRAAGDVEGHPFHGNQWATGLSLQDKRAIANFQSNDHISAKDRDALRPLLARTIKGGDLEHLRPSAGTRLYRGQDKEVLQRGPRSFATDAKTAKGFGSHLHKITIRDEHEALDLDKAMGNGRSEHEVIVNIRHDGLHALGDSEGHPFHGNQWTDAFGTSDKYVYHISDPSIPLSSFEKQGIKPSKDGYGGPGVYMAHTPEKTQYYEDLDKGRLFRIDKQKLIEKFGKYPENKNGVEYDDGTGEVVLGGDRAIPREFIDVKVDGKWRALGDSEGHPFHGNQWTAETQAILTQLRDPSFVNSTLRGQHKLTKEQQAHVDALDRAIAKAPASIGEETLYRAISRESLTDGYESGLASDGVKPGSTFTDHGYVSTSTDRQSVEHPGYVHPNDRAVLHVTVPAGTKALEPAAHVAEHPKAADLAGWEHEKLLPRGSTFRIDKVDGKNIHVTLLGSRYLHALGDVPGHEFHGNQWTAGSNAIEQGLTKLKALPKENGQTLSPVPFATTPKNADGTPQNMLGRMSEKEKTDAIKHASIEDVPIDQIVQSQRVIPRVGVVEHYVQNPDKIDQKIVNGDLPYKINSEGDVEDHSAAATHVLGVRTDAGVMIANGNHRVAAAFLVGKPTVRMHVLDFRDKTSRHLEVIRTAAPKLAMAFNTNDPRAIKWAKEHAAELATEISETTRDRITAAIADALEKGEDPRDIIADAVGSDVRAELIARTETMRAASEGQRIGWGQAVDKGLLSGNEQRVWIATTDACPECDALDGKLADLDGLYPGEGEDGPPLHPNCRCTEGISAGGDDGE